MTTNLIEKRRGASGEESSFVGGTRVRVSDIARLYTLIREELVAERIREAIPHLTDEQVRAAIEYWREHEDEIAGEIANEEALLNTIPPAY